MRVPAAKAPLALTREACAAGTVRWQRAAGKSPAPWWPLCPIVHRLRPLPSALPLAKVMMAALVDEATDLKQLRQQLAGLCSALGGLTRQQLSQPSGQLSSWQHARLLSALAILSPNPDIVLLPEASPLELEQWQRLITQYAPVAKTLWLFDPTLSRQQDTSLALAEGECRALWAGAALLLPSSLASPLPKGPFISTAPEPALEPAPEPAPEALVIDDRWLVANGLAGPKAEGVAGGAGRKQSLTTVDISLLFAGRSPAAVDLVVQTTRPLQLIWGCLSTRRQPQPLPARLAVTLGPEAKVKWLYMTAKGRPRGQPSRESRWGLGDHSRLEIVAITPDSHGSMIGSEAEIHLGQGAELAISSCAWQQGSKVCTGSSTYHNHVTGGVQLSGPAGSRIAIDSAWLGSGTSRSERAAKIAAEIAPERTLGKAQHQGCGFARQARREFVISEGMAHVPLRMPDLLWGYEESLPEVMLRDWPIDPAIALLESHQIEQPWPMVVEWGVPWLKERLPMEYWVDLVQLTEP